MEFTYDGIGIFLMIEQICYSEVMDNVRPLEEILYISLTTGYL